MTDAVSQLVLRARDEVGKTLTAVRNQARGVSDELGKIDKPPRNLLQAMGTLRKQLQGAEVDARNLRATYEQIAKAGAKIAAAGGIVTGINAAAVVKAANYSKEIGLIATLTSEGAEATEALEQQVIALSNQFGQDRQDVAQAYYQALSVGAEEGAEAVELLEVASRGAIGGNSSLGESLTAVTSIINAYGKDFSEAESVSDVLFATIEKGNTTMQQLGASIANVTPTAAGLGVSFQEVGAAIAALTLGGTQTSKATTQINALLQALAAGGDEVQAIYAGLGGAEAALATEGLQRTLQRLTTATGGSVAKLKELLGSQEAVAAALALGGSQADAFAGALERTNNSAGASQAAFDIMAETLGVKLDRALTALGNSFTQLGLALAPIAGAILDLVARVATLAGDFIAANPAIATFGAILAALAVAAGTALVALAAVGPLLGVIGGAAGTATGALAGLAGVMTGALGSAVGSFATLAGVARIALVGMTRAALAFIATPLGAGLAVVGAAAAYAFGEIGKLNKELDETAKASEEAVKWLLETNELLEDIESVGAGQDLVDAARELKRLGSVPFADREGLRAQRDAIKARIEAIRTTQALERQAQAQLVSAREAYDAKRIEADRTRIEQTNEAALASEEEQLRAALNRVKLAEQAEREALQRVADLKTENANTAKSIAEQLGDVEPARSPLVAFGEYLELQSRIAEASSAQEIASAQAALTEQVAAVKSIASGDQRRRTLNLLTLANDNLKNKILEVEKSEAVAAEARKAEAQDEVVTAQTNIATLKEEIKVLAEAAKVPLDIEVTQAEQRIESLKTRLEQLRSAAAGIVIGAGAGPAAPVPAFATGGAVRGRGGVDNILAWLSNREYVVNARRAQRFPGLLDVINYGSESLLKSLSIPRFATGGPVGDISRGSASLRPAAATSSGTPINVHLDGQRYPMTASADVAAQLQRVLGLEVLKRGRR